MSPSCLVLQHLYWNLSDPFIELWGGFNLMSVPTGAISVYIHCSTRRPWHQMNETEALLFTKLCICATQADETRLLRGSEVEGLKHNCPEFGPGQAG